MGYHRIGPGLRHTYIVGIFRLIADVHWAIAPSKACSFLVSSPSPCISFRKERKTGKYTHMYNYCYFFSTRKEYSEVFYAYVHLHMYVYVRMHFNCIFACMGIRIGAHILNM